MPRPNVIGICGPARSGKDATALLLQAYTGGYIYSMAGPLKAMLKAGFGIDMADPYWDQHKEDVIEQYGRSPREMMQTLGTEWGRVMVHRDVWLILAKGRLFRDPVGMIIPDVRFANEAAFVRERGVLIHVSRPEAPGVAAHSSEKGIAYEAGDIKLANNGTLEDLRASVRESLTQAWGLGV